MNLRAFVESRYSNAWIKYGPLNSYYRQGPLYIGQDRFNKVLTRANTVNKKRSRNFDTALTPKSTGVYKGLDDLTFDLAKEFSFDGVFVENVLNPFLPDVLVRYGYVEVTRPGSSERCFWKPIKGDSK